MQLLNAKDIFDIHEDVINANELQGLAANKSLEGVVARVENRLAYDMIGDVFDLAAIYCVVIAKGHVFNDANKRTAFMAMMTCLAENNIFLDLDIKIFGQLIIDVAQGTVDEIDLANYLREKASQY